MLSWIGVLSLKVPNSSEALGTPTWKIDIEVPLLILLLTNAPEPTFHSMLLTPPLLAVVESVHPLRNPPITKFTAPKALLECALCIEEVEIVSDCVVLVGEDAVPKVELDPSNIPPTAVVP